MARLIDADALCRHLSDWQYGSMTDGKHDVEYGVIENVIEGIEKEPTIDAVPVRHGKWVKADSQQYFRKHYPAFTCSECGYRKDSQKTWNYCPQCGARMDEERKEE